MRHLVDPAAIAPGLASWSFLALLLVILPAAVVLQQRRLARATDLELDRRTIYASAAMTHAVLLLGAWLALRELPEGVIPLHPVRGLDVAIALVALAVGLIPLAGSRWTGATGRARAALIAPRTRGEFVGFAGVATSAGIAEEIAYRCVLFALLSALTGGWWAPAIIGSIAFGVAHAFQGWRSAALAAALALVAQVTLGITGNVLLVMAVHLVHDLVAGVVISRRAGHDHAREGGSAIAVP